MTRIVSSAGAWLLAVFGGMFLLLALAAAASPRFAEAMEGDVAQHVERIAAGLPPYAPATAEFIPLAYHPLHYYLSAPLLGLLGNGLAAARAVSAFAAVWSAACVGLWAWRETRSPNAACLAAALFCASLRACDGALFAALPDSTLLAFTLSGWLLLDGPPGRRREFAALLCFGAAFWTKQHGALYFGAAVAYATLFRANALPRWAFGAALLALGPGAWFAAGKLWPEFRHFTFEVPGAWPRSWGASAGRFAYMAAVEVPFAAALVFAAALTLAAAGRRRPSALAWFVATSCGANLFTMTTAGSSNNHYIPTVAGLCVLAVVSCRRLAGGPAPSLPWLVGAAFAAAAGMSTFAARKYPEHLHAIPEHAPWRALAAGTVAWWLVRRVRPHAAWPAAALAAQFGVALFHPGAYWGGGLGAGGAAATALGRFREHAGPRGGIAWIDYGFVPLAGAGGPFGRWPSWVVLDDLSRAAGRADAPDLEPFRQQLRERPPALLLSALDDLSGVPVWRDFARLYGPPEDLGDRHAALRQIAVHWYSDRFPPRYLFRLRAGPEPRGAGAAP